MPVADGTRNPANAVIVPCADAGVLPVRIRCLLVHRIAENIADTLEPAPVAVCVQGKVPFLVISEGFLVAKLVGTLADFPKAVVAVLDDISVSVHCPADLSRGGIAISFLYAVRKTDSCNAPPSVHVI